MPVIVRIPGICTERKSFLPISAVKRPSFKNMPIIQVASQRRLRVLIGNLSLQALMTPHTIFVNLPAPIEGSTMQIVLTHAKAKSLAQSIAQGVVPLSMFKAIQSLGTVPSLSLPIQPVGLPTFSLSIISRELPLALETPMEANASLLLPPTLPVEFPTPSFNYLSRELPLLNLSTPVEATPMQIVLTHFDAKSLAQSTTQGACPLLCHTMHSLDTVPLLLLLTLPVALPTFSLNFIPRDLSLFIEFSSEVNNFPLIFESRSIQGRRARPSARWARFVRRYLRVPPAPKPKLDRRARQKARGPSPPSLFESSFILLSTSPWVLHIPSPWEAFYFHLFYDPLAYTGHRAHFCPSSAPRGTSFSTLRCAPFQSAPRGPRFSAFHLRVSILIGSFDTSRIAFGASVPMHSLKFE
ncbi:hypothetical protein Taro_050329 [Colocasia esculenta]|uniref:Uncharacterized protein n=1 Tax=Colocasia esculenta TaxID=4460 RepID=A0A843XDI9_COLES|nr:hypothetical protein [Colocasia esculenta]